LCAWLGGGVPISALAARLTHVLHAHPEALTRVRAFLPDVEDVSLAAVLHFCRLSALVALHPRVCYRLHHDVQEPNAPRAASSAAAQDLAVPCSPLAASNVLLGATPVATAPAALKSVTAVPRATAVGAATTVPPPAQAALTAPGASAAMDVADGVQAASAPAPLAPVADVPLAATGSTARAAYASASDAARVAAGGLAVLDDQPATRASDSVAALHSDGDGGADVAPGEQQHRSAGVDHTADECFDSADEGSDRDSDGSSFDSADEGSDRDDGSNSSSSGGGIAASHKARARTARASAARSGGMGGSGTTQPVSVDTALKLAAAVDCTAGAASGSPSPQSTPRKPAPLRGRNLSVVAEAPEEGDDGARARRAAGIVNARGAVARQSIAEGVHAPAVVPAEAAVRRTFDNVSVVAAAAGAKQAASPSAAHAHASGAAVAAAVARVDVTKRSACRPRLVGVCVCLVGMLAGAAALVLRSRGYRPAVDRIADFIAFVLANIRHSVGMQTPHA